MKYDHIKIEKEWQRYWDLHETFKTDVWDFSKPKFYALDMFPYPSGHGLHVGHPEGYTASDIVSRVKRMQGYNVLHPMGWDAFGLPAEQYAIKTGNHPGLFTEKNIKTFKRQLKMLGFSFDWSKEISTADPKFYKWTQWIFKQLFLEGLAYQKETSVNWCEELGTVLANDEVIDGKSERGGYPVIKKSMKQWVMNIPAYAEKLLENLETLDWPESTKEIQRNWIGKSVGANVNFKVADSDKDFTVFTTRCDTLFGATYCVLAPEHKLVKEIMSAEQKDAVLSYINDCSLKSEQDRTNANKEKTGVFTGAYAVNPVNNKKVPIWISDYVLISYGSGAIMAVPAHDERDYAFAKKFNLEIIPVLDGGDITKEAYTSDGLHINSSFINGLGKKEAIDKMLLYLEENKIGNKKITYKIREWIFARQRYWGEPIPVLHFLDDGETVCLSDEELPLILPVLDDYKAKESGSAPLENAVEWKNVERNNRKALRETNTMPGSAGSSWYYMRYIDPDNEEEFVNKELAKHWLPVDLYIGGSEHAVGHLLYSRFWNNFLFDKGYLSSKEPFQKIVHQGMILGENNEKMSKSKGNVVNPDDVVERYGADTLRLYEMFMGPLEASLPWNENGLEGARKFLDRVWRFMTEDTYRERIVEKDTSDLEKIYHQTVKKVTNDYERLSFNTAIAQMMIFMNEAYKAKEVSHKYILGFIKMIYPIAPHFGEELWKLEGNKESITYATWPEYDEEKTKDEDITIVFSVNGKVRDKVNVSVDTTKSELEKMALSSEKISSFTDNKTIVKVIVVPKKLVNIVVK